MLAIRATRMFDGKQFATDAVTVLIDQDRVQAIEAGWPDPPDDWQVHDHPNSTVLPGLIDAHVHLVADSGIGALDRVPGYTDDELDAVVGQALRDQLAAGVTTVRDLGDRRFAVIARRDRQRSGRTDEPEPTIVASGPPITSPGGHTFYMGGEVADRAAIDAAIGVRAERAVDVVKVMASGGMSTPGTDVMGTQFGTDDLRYLVDRAHAVGLPVTAHAHGLPAVRQSIEVGVDCIEHCTCLTDKGFDLSDELVAALAASGIAVSGIIPPPPVMDLAEAPPTIRALAVRTGMTPERFRSIRADMVGRMHRAGTRIATGIDAGISPMLAHGRLHTAVTFLAEAGLPPEAALAAATSTAAEVCGVGDRKGLLRNGYDADILVVDGDLLADPGAVQNVRSVVLGGVVVR